MSAAVETQKTLPSAAQSMSLLSSSTDLFNMFGLPSVSDLSPLKRELDVPSEESYVICAVLDDASRTRVRIGSARYYASSGTYHMLDGSLQILESSKSADDGLYRDSTGTYALMTEKQFEKEQKPAPVVVAAPRVDPTPAAPPAPPTPPAPAAPASPPTQPVPDPLPEPTPKLAPVSAPLAPISASAALPPISKPSVAKQSEREEVGCGYGSNTKTVFVAGNFEGDSSRLDVVMKQSKALAIKAAGHGNRVLYAFMGNVMPDVHRPGPNDDNIDSFSRILAMAESGIRLTESYSVSPEDVILITGTRELAWLRLANPNSETREIAPFDSADARDVLLRKTPLSGMKGSVRNHATSAHNDGLHLLDGFSTANGVAVAMLLKLVSLTQSTMQAPGIVGLFAKRLLAEGTHDNASLVLLLDFLSSFKGGVEDGVSRLRDDTELTPEGMAITPAAKAVVQSVISFAQNAAARYMRKSKLVHCVIDKESSDGELGLWLTPRGTDYGSIVGKLPSGVDRTSLRVKWKEGPVRKLEWSKALNKEFRHFVKTFMEGNNSASLEMYQAFMAMSLETNEAALPLQDLAASPQTLCNGVAANISTPFGTVQRRILVRDAAHQQHNQSDLLKVLDQWTNINTDAYTPSTYWGVSTWCGGTKSDIVSYPAMMSMTDKLETQLWHVSVTLASLLTVRVKDRAVKEYGASTLSGILGPVIVGHSPGQKQPMRIVSFTHEKMEAAFVLLLPEAFVQWSLDYYNYDLEYATGHSAPMLATEGFLALPDEAAVPLGFPGLSEAETELIRSELGTRVWSLPKKRSEKSITAFTATDYDAIEAMKRSDGPSRALAIPGYSIFHTRQSSSDPFAGLHVGLANIPVKGYEARMTIVADSMPSHDIFRVVARE